MVRPGLLLYGYGEFADELGLLPVMTLKTTVSTIKIYPAGTAISYGGIFKTEHTTRIGVVPYGLCRWLFPLSFQPLRADDKRGTGSAAREDLHGHVYDRSDRENGCGCWK